MDVVAGKQFKNRVILSLIALFSICFIVGQAVAADALSPESAAHAAEAAIQQVDPGVAKFAVISAAVAFAFGALGAGIAIAYVGASAVAAVGEKPEIAGQALIFVALAEGIVVFGFITALMILGKA